jgi:HTH-type transcriptional regulator/antitoxin HigA
MNWKVLKTEDDYTKATNRLMEIFHAEANTPQNDELELLLVLVKDYDDKHYPIPEANIEK